MRGLFEIVEMNMTDVGGAVRSAHPAIMADTMADPRLSYWLAIGNNHGWGRSDKSEKQAIAYMNKNGLQGMKATKYAIYRCTPNTTINEMGALHRPSDDPVAVQIKRVGY